MLHGKANEPIERLQQIDADLATLVRTWPLDRQFVARWVLKCLDIEQRLATTTIDI